MLAWTHWHGHGYSAAKADEATIFLLSIARRSHKSLRWRIIVININFIGSRRRGWSKGHASDQWRLARTQSNRKTDICSELSAYRTSSDFRRVQQKPRSKNDAKHISIRLINSNNNNHNRNRDYDNNNLSDLGRWFLRFIERLERRAFYFNVSQRFNTFIYLFSLARQLG